MGDRTVVVTACTGEMFGSYERKCGLWAREQKWLPLVLERCSVRISVGTRAGQTKGFMYNRQVLYFRGGQLDDIREPQLWKQLRQEPSIDDESPPPQTPLRDGLFFYVHSNTTFYFLL